MGRKLRILRELRSVFRAGRADVRVYWPPDTICQWRVFPQGPPDSFYGGGWWHIFVKFPELYPDQPPEICFVIVPYHPNVSGHRRVCRQILFEGYHRDTAMLTIFDDLKAMFANPDSELAMDVGVDKRLGCRFDAADADALRRLVQESTERVSETVEEDLIGVVGGPRDDSAYMAPRKLAHRRKQKQERKRKRVFGNSREYCLIDRTTFHIFVWSFRRGGFLSAGKLSAANIFGHRRVCHSILPNLSNLPKRVYEIVVDGIESHPFHPEIEDNWFLVHQATNPKRPSLRSFFAKKGEGKGEWKGKGKGDREKGKGKRL
jgi:ubiquitin-protein ligase